jgi:DNA-binding SARP family transcriptional activator
MFTLKVLGTIELQDAEGRRISSVLSQPKRLAMLAVLALEAPRRLQRDEVMALLWPEQSQERGRNALRQALHYLRRSLGPGVVVGRNAEGIGVEPDKLWCDATALLRAAESGQNDEVLGLYDGELLPGFHLDDTPLELERWLEEKRRRIRQAAGGAAWRVAANEAESGNGVAAAVAVRRALEVGDWSEAGLRDVLERLIARGDGETARAIYEEYAAGWEREAGREPSEATAALVRGTADVSTPPSANEETEVEAEEASEPGSSGTPTVVPGDPAETSSAPLPRTVRAAGETRAAVAPPARRRRSWPGVLAAGVAVVALLQQLVGWSSPVAGVLPGDQDPGDSPYLYLEPVQALAVDEGADRLAQALTRELAAELAETEGFQVVALAEGRPAPERAGVLLRPSLRSSESGTQLGVLALDPTSSVVLDQFTVTGVEPEPESLTETVAARMALEIRRGVGELLSWQGLEARGISPNALERVRAAAQEVKAANALRAQGAWEAAALGYQAADSLLELAANADPRWIEPTRRRAELAVENMWLYLVPPNRQPTLAHREVVRGERLARAAVEGAASEDRARALETRGVLRYWAARTAEDPEDLPSFERAAERDLEAAVRLDPNLPRAWNTLSVLSENRGDFAVAYHRALRAYATDRDVAIPLDVMVRLFTNALEVGDDAAAATWCREANERRPSHWLGPYCDLVRRAWVGPWTAMAADSLLEAVEARTPDGPMREPLLTRFRLLKGVILARGGDVSGAREILASLDPRQPPDIEVVTLRAWIRTSLGDTHEARTLLARGSSGHDPAPPRVLQSRRFSDLSSYAVVRSDQ